MNNLKALRVQKGLSQQKLADILNISQQSVHKYEHNLSEPDIQVLKEMSELFNTSIDYIVGNTDCPYKTDFVEETELTPQELEHLRLYRNLPSYRKKLIDMLLEDYNKEH